MIKLYNWHSTLRFILTKLNENYEFLKDKL